MSGSEPAAPAADATAVPVVPDEAACPACGAPPSPGAWCMACGSRFDAAPASGTLPPGGAVAARKFACAGCGALMLYDAKSGALSCPFCGGSKGIERGDDYAPVEHALDDVPADRLRADAPKTFRCEDCGAEVRFEGVTIAARCPFCGADHVVERTGAAGRILPESVLPFAIDRAKAADAWTAWLGKGWFRPRGFRSLASKEGLAGVYVPFWTFDARTWSRWTAMAGFHYTVTVPDGRGGSRTETRTRWQPAAGERRGDYDDVLVCASTSLVPKLLAKVEPFGLPGLERYRAEFLSGWLAEEYAVELAAGWGVARDRINAMERTACSRDVPGDTQMALRVWTQHHDVTWKHVLLPVWLATYRFRDKTYRVLINGETGRVGGHAPVSIVKVALAVLIAAALGFGVYWLVRR